MPTAEELMETAQWGDAPPVRFEDQKLDLLAFELWQQASRPEILADGDWLGTEDETV